MGSERCIVEISSSDEDSSDEEDGGILLIGDSNTLRPLESHKRSMASLHSIWDNEVLLIEKQQCPEGRRMEKSTSVFVENKKFVRKTGDDDCCILDHDPEKSVPALDSQSNDAEDLVLIGASGPVACRDYPHARYVCAKFPFESTPHESFCEQCHCYVCDVLAPCSLWGQGKQSSDHCHAFDKEERWKILRNLKKPLSLPAATAISSPPPLRPGRSRIQSLSSMAITSISFGSSVSNGYPDAGFPGVPSHPPWTSYTSSLSGHPSPFIPATVNITRVSEAMFSDTVPSTVNSAQARTANMNRPVRTASPRMRNTNHGSSNATNQSSMTSVSSAKKGGPHLTDQNLSNLVYGSEVPIVRARSTHASLQRNARVHMKGQRIAQQQTRRMNSVSTKASQPIATVPEVPVANTGGLRQVEPFQSFPMSFSNFSTHELVTLRDCLFNGLSEQREREEQMVQGAGRPNMSEIGSIQSTGLVHHFVPDGTVRDGSYQERLGRPWEQVNISQASGNSKISEVMPSQVSESQTVGLENIHNRTPGTGQNVQLKTVAGAYHAAFEDSHQKMLDHRTPFVHEVDASPALDDILAQLDCSELFADFDFYSS